MKRYLVTLGKVDTFANDYFATSAGALKSNDGLFLCTPDHAAAVAYMMSEAEAAIIRCRADTTWVSDILIKYLEGEISSAEARAEFREDGHPAPERASAETTDA